MQYPSRYTKPLEADENGWAVHSQGYRLIALIESRWTFANSLRPRIDEWQKFFLVNALETYGPDHPMAGRLRFRAVLFSAARQQGKSTLAAWISLYLIIQHVRAPNIIGISETREHGKVIYSQLVHAINHDEALSKILKATSTRGIGKRDGSGSYTLYPSKQNKLQGLATSGALIDEVHLLERQAWDSLVNGQAAQQDSIIFGLTTAGDDTSELLDSLYTRANDAISDPDSDPRYGAFIWEAHDPNAALDNVDAIHQANPAIECGRIDLQTRLKDVQHEPEFTRRRFLHNRFVSSLNPALDPAQWRDLTDPNRVGITDFQASGIWVGIDVSKNNSHVTASAARKRADGIIEVTVIASWENPTWDQLKAFTDELQKSPNIKVAGWIMDHKLSPVTAHLNNKGRRLLVVNSAAIDTGSANLAHSLMASGRISHDGNRRVADQLARAVAKNKGDSWRLVPPKAGVPLDAIHSVIFAMWATETSVTHAPMLMVI